MALRIKSFNGLSIKPLNIAVLFMERVVSNAINKFPDQKFDLDFFESKDWPSRPNSTSRLNIVNYQALRDLAKTKSYKICFFGSNRCVFDFDYIFKCFDTVIINQIAGVSSIDFVKSLVLHCKKNGISSSTHNIVFGTELSFYNELKKGSFTIDELRFVYNESTILRHTPKTDMPLYYDDRCLNSNVIEFEIGIDTEIVQNKLCSEKMYITFVAAPEGRVTKNNDRINRIVSVLLDQGVEHERIKIVKPPYSTTEYWNILKQSFVLVFTSDGETFSYVLNDAKSMGIPSLYPVHMYYASVGKFLSIDSYPFLGVKYKDDMDAVSFINKLYNDDAFYKECSDAARSEVLDNFSLDAVKHNWDRLLSGNSLCINRLLIFSSGIYVDDEMVVKTSSVTSSKYVISIGNFFKSPFVGLSEKVFGQDVFKIKYYLNFNEFDCRKEILGCDNSESLASKISDSNNFLNYEVGYWDLLFRTYKINHVNFVCGSNSDFFPESLKKVIISRGVTIDFV